MMIKKIKVEALQAGMFIHDLNSSWWAHPFAKNSFMVREDKVIQKIIKAGIREVYIDTQKGKDAVNQTTLQQSDRVPPPLATHFVEDKVEKVEPVPLRDEMVKAKSILIEAAEVVRNFMSGVQIGRPIDLPVVQKIVSDMVESIFRNEDALVCLSRIKEKDLYTFQHSISVSVLMISFARRMNFNNDVIIQIGTGGLLHDVGKMKVPVEILNKPGPLNDRELEIMKNHVVYGEEILARTSGLTPLSLRLVAEHHERVDGKGYPQGLQGDKISLIGQMGGIVDVFDALTSNRVYRSPMDPNEALKDLLQRSEDEFREELVHFFIKTIGVYPVGTLVRLKNKLLGVVVKQSAMGLLYPTVRILYDTHKQSFVSPWELNLFPPEGENERFQIANPEPAGRWNIDPYNFL
jgi:putative nucleotidyltransferase with HDIG domain